MSAKEMFKNLGFKFEYGNDDYIRYTINSKDLSFIQFWIEDKEIHIGNYEDYTPYLSFDMINAISKQIEGIRCKNENKKRKKWND